MFSGIIEQSATITTIDKSGKGYRITLQANQDLSDVGIGDSIAIDGVCLTVVQKEKQLLDFELAEETLRRTTLGKKQAGSRVNFELSLKLGDRIHGHFVFGHVDGVARLKSRTPEGDSEKYVFTLPEELMPGIVEKGSISLSGVSLTVGEVESKRFSVYIIPHTSKITTLSDLSSGDVVNVELDMLGRYVQRFLSCSNGNDTLTKEHLSKAGFIS